MLNRIIAAALANRAIVLLFALLVGGYGLFKAANTPIDVLPDLNRPIVTVMTEAHGMVPEDVERLVTWPIEQVMNGATGVFRVRSASGLGLSVVYVEFDWGTDIYLDRQIVAEKLQSAVPALPPDVQPILDSICIECHTPGGPWPSLDMTVDAYDDLVNADGIQTLALTDIFLVVPGDPESSYILYKLAGTQERIAGAAAGAQMPQGFDPLPLEQQDTIRTWIECGAPR